MIHNALRYAPTWSRAYQRICGGDPEVQVERLAETISPALDLWSQPDWLLALDVTSWGGAAAIAAGGAGFNSCLFLNNPAGSNIIAVVRGAWGDCGAAVGQLSLSNLTVGRTGGTPGNELDTRTRFGGSRCLLESFNTAATPAGANIGPRVQVPANSTSRLLELGDYFVLHPGETFGIVNITTNSLLNASMKWTERRALPGELPAT